MTAISWGQGHLRSCSKIRCPLPQAMFLPRFVGMTKGEKNWKAAILWNLEQLDPHFALHSRTTQRLCIQIILLTSICNNESSKTATRFFWILWRRLQTYQKLFMWVLMKNINRNVIKHYMLFLNACVWIFWVCECDWIFPCGILLVGLAPH